MKADKWLVDLIQQMLDGGLEEEDDFTEEGEDFLESMDLEDSKEISKNIKAGSSGVNVFIILGNG